MDRTPSFSIIIVSLNGGPVIARVLDSLRLTDYPNFEVIVVDNGSTDNLAEIVKKYPEVRLIQSPVNLGFAGGNNLGIREAQGDIIVLLNDDTEVRPEWLTAWAKAAAEYPEWGILGCKLLYPDGITIQHAGGKMQTTGNTFHFGYGEKDDGRFDSVIECDYVTGAAIAIRRELIDWIGLLDDKYYPIYFEETDYCWQARRIGYLVLYIPDSVVIHYESRTQTAYSFKFLYRYTRSRIRFLCKCFSGKQLLRAARAEMKWWIAPYSWQCYAPYLCAYLYALIHLPIHLRDRSPFLRRLEKIALAREGKG